MFLFKTQLSTPAHPSISKVSRSYRGEIRYGHARHRRPTHRSAADAALTLIELPRVQAVVDAIRYDRAA